MQSPYPAEPRVWLKRLAVVRSQEELDDPLREIEFRLGLNVIKADDAPLQASFGHNVGKTLLVRLIRYCLGDAQYAGTNMRRRIRDVLPDAWVAAVVSVQETTWSVLRSLGHGRRGWCVQGDDWRLAFQDHESRRPFSEFQAELERLVPAEFTNVKLAGLDRSPAWPDLLGWLARDQACRYTHHNDWRTPDADAGVAALSLGNANLITRLVMGLFDADENQHTQQLEALRADTRTQEAEKERLRLAAAIMRASLVTVAPVSSEVPDGPLFIEAIREQVRQRRESQERLLEDPDHRRGLDHAERELAEAQRLLGRASGRLEELDRRWRLVSDQLTAVAPSRPEDRAMLSCGLAECLHLTDRGEALRDPMREQRIRDYTTEIEQLNREITVARSILDQQEQAVREATTRRDEARLRYGTITSGIRRSLARYEAASEDLERYEMGQTRLSAVENHLRMNQERDKEIDKQREARASSRDRAMAELNIIFEEVTRALLSQASGELVLNLRDGLAPRTVASPGEAFGTTGKVIGFDLTCLLAGMLGHGNHPRLLVHDSPREADMHPWLYENLFRFAQTLESRFPGNPPAFQYIATTTTPPPEEASDLPYVRATLNAIPATDRLLRAEF